MKLPAMALAAALVFASSPIEPIDAPQDAAASRPAPAASDVATPEALVLALYDVISGPAGAARDWSRFRSLFHPGARLVAMRPGKDGAPRPTEMSVEDYATRAGPMLEKNGFFETGLAAKFESFGAVAHAFSTYESRRAKDDPVPFARGINTIQMIRTDRGWSVLSIAWDEERPDNPIPARFLPGGAAK